MFKATNFAKIERFLLNIVFRKRRIITVKLSECIDEFGNSFGKNGSHFFVKALNESNDKKYIITFLKKYYAENTLSSFIDILNDDAREKGKKKYFCPWEENRVRDTEKFLGSHKIGPTPDIFLEKISERLLCVLQNITNEGFKQFTILDGIPRVYALVNINNDIKYVVRDGQHRAAVLSYLNIDEIKCCYESVYFRRSFLYYLFNKITKRHVDMNQQTYLSCVYESELENWPHVKNGNISMDAAKKYFDFIFYGKFLN